MANIKLSITCRKKLAAKYDQDALASIDAAVRAWIAADKARGLKTVHVAVDDAKALKPFKVPAIKGSVTAQKVKKTVDALVKKLNPDYIVLFGSTDVVPSFEVPNPSASEDDESTVPTDNPYASSQPFSRARRASYLIPDRVVGRIPDVPGSGDPAWLVSCLSVASSWQAGARNMYDKDLLVCCDTWEGGGRECVDYIGRDPSKLLLSPPAKTASASVRGRHGARLQMIKCHGAGLDSQFYGQKGNSYPPVLSSVALQGRVQKKTVVGAMCCYGASVFDPQSDEARAPGEPPIPSVYLRGGAYGFLGATNTAWVGPDSMMCADWVVAAFLKSVLSGASLGRATLESKQDFVRWTQQQGHGLDAADEKTLLQFVLLGDPSIHPIRASVGPEPAGVPAADNLSSGAATARRARRTARRDLAVLLRGGLPRVTDLRGAKIPATFNRLARALAKPRGARAAFRWSATRVERAVHPKRPVAAAGAASSARGKPASTIHYYFVTREKKGPGPNLRMVSIQADQKGAVMRTKLLVSS